MAKDKIDKTHRYIFERLHNKISQAEGKTPEDTIRTGYVHKGQITLTSETNGETVVHQIKEGNGFCAPPGIQLAIESKQEADVFMVSSEAQSGVPVVEIIDDGDGQREEEITQLKLIIDPKRVTKPWGHELWIMWTSNYHVMKQIGMTKGKQCSLQFHREKLETNYLIEGKADVIGGIKVDRKASEETIQAAIKDLDLSEYTNSIKPGQYWTSEAGTIHRVMAREDYIAYEVSTPELDDCIRLEDDTNRGSHRILSEHKKEAHAL